MDFQNTKTEISDIPAEACPDLSVPLDKTSTTQNFSLLGYGALKGRLPDAQLFQDDLRDWI